MARGLEGIFVELQPMHAAANPQLRVQARPSRASYTLNPPPSFGSTLARETRAVGAASAKAESAAPYTIRSGDTLTGIVSQQLKALGRSATGADVHDGVQAIARSNNIQNPNRIQPGQTLDLSVLSHPGMDGQGGPAPMRRPVGLATWLGQRAPHAADEPGSISRRLEAILTPKVPATAPGKELVDGDTEISSGYGLRRDPFTGERALHAGVDLAAERGSDIHPYRDGEVVFSGWQRGYGRIVVVRHDNGMESAYAHNDKNLVRVGDKVTRDTVLAEVGSSGRATGPHVHFEVRKNGRAINPLPYLATMKMAKAD